jgi:ATP-binding cassette subfamily A (ABC1) protein 3
VLNEREKNLKHMQMISGMSLPAYWVANYLFDIIKSIIPSAVVIGLIYAFDLKYDNVWILFLLYPIGVIPFTYVTSFVFAGENVAQTVTIFAHFVFAGIGGIVVFILRLIDSTRDAGDIMLWVFKIMPSFCLTNSIMFASSRDTIINVREDLSSDTFDIWNMGGDILALGVHFIFWTIILIIIESSNCSSCKRCPDKLKKNQVPYNKDLNLDEDVIEEEQRVASISPEGMRVRVNGFRKVYT